VRVWSVRGRTAQSVSALLMAVTCVSTGCTRGGNELEELPASREPATNAREEPSDVLVEYRPVSFEGLVKKVNPGVVSLTTKIKGNKSPQDQLPGSRGRSLGTGFVIDSGGLVLTNHHVIANAVEIEVRLWNERQLSAKVIGTDPKTDIALLKVEVDSGVGGLSPLKLGDSDQLAVGEWVVAIGNAMGLSSTVTAGIVSAKGRTEVPIGGDVTYVDFIQTDASINPGNSGGPLLNMRGEVIGINTAISRSGQGIGFAIPINMAQTLLPQLKKGKVTRSWLGVYVSAVSEDLASRHGLSQTEGAMVRRIVDGSPAATGGLKVGDVILAFNGTSVKQINDLRWQSAVAGIGERVKLKVSRAGEGIREMWLVMAKNPRE